MTPKLTPALSTSATTVPAGTVSSFARRASLSTSSFGSIENNGTPARTSRGVVMARCYARATMRRSLGFLPLRPLSAAGIIGELAAAGLIVLADKGYHGAGDPVLTPYWGRTKPASQKQ